MPMHPAMGSQSWMKLHGCTLTAGAKDSETGGHSNILRLIPQEVLLLSGKQEQRNQASMRSHAKICFI